MRCSGVWTLEVSAVAVLSNKLELILLYKAETWIQTKALSTVIDSFDLRCQRHILRTPCPEKKRPEYFSHNFDKFRHSFVFFGTNHPDTSMY